MVVDNAPTFCDAFRQGNGWDPPLPSPHRATRRVAGVATPVRFVGGRPLKIIFRAYAGAATNGVQWPTELLDEWGLPPTGSLEYFGTNSSWMASAIRFSGKRPWDKMKS
jgi:hypothetical protein